MLAVDNLHQQVLDNLYDGVYVVDAEGRIRYWNHGAEAITGYSELRVVGFECSNDLLMHMDEDGRLMCGDACPLKATLADGVKREAEAYLHHADGHRVPVHIRITPVIEDGRVVGAVHVFSDNSRRAELMARIRKLEELSFLDELTGASNRRHGELLLAARLQELARYGMPFGVMMLDIDHFKRVNDGHGHPSGDQVLRMVAATLRESVRGSDVVCRWGGEEFLVILINIAPPPLGQLAERMRTLVAGSFITDPTGENIRTTISIGATQALPHDTLDSIVARVDDLLYRSKSDGRNRVTVG
jgi:diguanylate cyclase (GGDEF)-like protein/PAS domain S-box-containing protein